MTLSTQVYLGRGELMARVGEVQPEVSNRIRVNIFWMGKSALRMGRDYFLKLGTTKVAVRLHHINYLIDASENGREHDPDRVERHDVADCILQLRKPIAFDAISSLEGTGRFVIVDQYEIAGGGIIREALAADADTTAGVVQAHKNLLHSTESTGSVTVLVAQGTAAEEAIERIQKQLRQKIAVLSLPATSDEAGSAVQRQQQEREDLLKKLGEAAYYLAAYGAPVLIQLDELDDMEKQLLGSLISPISMDWKIL